MKEVIFTKDFRKQFAKQPKKVQRQFDIRYDIWYEDPANPILRVHRLKGKLGRYYSMDVTGDVRALYEIVGETVFIYDMIGTHSQFYK